MTPEHKATIEFLVASLEEWPHPNDIRPDTAPDGWRWTKDEIEYAGCWVLVRRKDGLKTIDSYLWWMSRKKMSRQKANK